jgi:hypothetical protein
MLVLIISGCTDLPLSETRLNTLLQEQLTRDELTALNTKPIDDWMLFVTVRDKEQNLGCLTVSISGSGSTVNLLTKQRLFSEIERNQDVLVLRMWQSGYDMYCIVIQDEHMREKAERVIVTTHDDHVLLGKIEYGVGFAYRDTDLYTNKFKDIQIEDRNNNIIYTRAFIEQ